MKYWYLYPILIVLITAMISIAYFKGQQKYAGVVENSDLKKTLLSTEIVNNSTPAKDEPKLPEKKKPPTSEKLVKPVIKKSIYSLGNSLTFGTGSGGDDYTDRLMSLLGPNWSVENHGIAGNTTTQMLERIDSKSDYTIVWGGINDIYRAVPASTTTENLTKIYDAVHGSNGKVIALYITPSKGDPNWSPEKQDSTEYLNNWIKSSTADYKIDTYSTVQDPNNPGHILPLYDAGDHLHLQQDGYWAVADKIYSLLKNIESF